MFCRQTGTSGPITGWAYNRHFTVSSFRLILPTNRDYSNLSYESEMMCVRPLRHVTLYRKKNTKKLPSIPITQACALVWRCGDAFACALPLTYAVVLTFESVDKSVSQVKATDQYFDVALFIIAVEVSSMKSYSNETS